MGMISNAHKQTWGGYKIMIGCMALFQNQTSVWVKKNQIKFEFDYLQRYNYVFSSPSQSPMCKYLKYNDSFYFWCHVVIHLLYLATFCNQKVVAKLYNLIW